MEKADFIEYLLDAEDDSGSVGAGSKKLTEKAKKMLILERKVPKHMQEIIRSMGSLLFADSDTTASPLTVVTMFLAKYPEVQERMRDEIDAFCVDEVRIRVFRHKLSPIQFVSDVVQELTYTDACLREVMRLVPIASG